jgi:hypothetical protein
LALTKLGERVEEKPELPELLEEPEVGVTDLLSGDCGADVVAGGALAVVKDAVNCCVIALAELTTEVAEIVGVAVEILADTAFVATEAKADLV